MKAMQFINLILLFASIISCTDSDRHNSKNTDIDSTIINVSDIALRDTFERGKVITHVSCKADAAQSYALYIPAKSDTEALPVIYFFDPHGDGSFPLEKYKELADLYHYILIGSNNSKNGNDWAAAENIWNIMFDDSQKRLKINNSRVYVCGFSGGAKVATYLALNHNQIKAVIANGAALPDITEAGNFGFSFTAISGEGDLNMTDLVAITNGLDKTQTRHHIIFFNGTHEWAPESTMNIAFEGLQLDAMAKKVIPADNKFIASYIANNQKIIIKYLKENNYLKAETACKLSISMLSGLTSDVEWFKEKFTSLKKNPSYQKQSEEKQKLLIKEQNLKNEYEQQFEHEDLNYWFKTIKNIEARGNLTTPEGAMYQRLKAYLSLAFYSISNQFIKNNQNDNAQYFVTLYKLVDPANSEAWYLAAILEARNNNAKAAEDDLLKAVSNGFNDKARLMQQTEFKKQGLQINLNEIESKMK